MIPMPQVWSTNISEKRQVKGYLVVPQDTRKASQLNLQIHISKKESALTSTHHVEAQIWESAH